MRQLSLYGIQCGEFIKIGISRNIPFRLNSLKLGNPMPCKVVLRRNPPYAGWLERRMHQHLAERAVGREWFRLTPQEAREAYNLLVVEAQQMLRDQVTRERRDLELVRKRPFEYPKLLI